MSLNWNALKDLNESYGDSFYLFDSTKFIDNYNEFVSEFRKIYDKTFIGYSYKTNYMPRICSLVDELGGYAEVVSDMEYDLAIKTGVKPENIIVNGPYKSIKNLRRYLLDGATVHLDSSVEVNNVLQIAVENPSAQLKLALRCNFEINSSLISRFGFDVNSDDFVNSFDKLNSARNVTIRGLHCHFPNRDVESYGYRVESILQLADQMFDSPPEYLDIGGGYFGKMNESLKEQFDVSVASYKDYAREIATKFNEHYSDMKESSRPKLILEPGSALVADTLSFVTKVIDIKNIRSKCIAMTAGSKFNMGLLSSKINMPVQSFSDTNDGHYYKDIDISGYTCIEGDYLFKGYEGNLSINDYLLFENVGSYSIVFKPPFILPNVAVLEYNMVNHKYNLIKNVETFDDVFSTYIF